MDLKKQTIFALKQKREEIIEAIAVFKDIAEHDLSTNDKSYLKKLVDAKRKVATKLFLLS